jgi:hypothetical protein
MQFALLLLLLLTGCAFQSAYEPPVVDMRGVDQQRYAQDLHDCTEAKKNAGFVTVGQPISDCLEKRGYTVTLRKS